MPNDEPLLTVQQAAHLLSVKKRWIYEACARHEIPYIKVGRLTRFRRSELDAWLDAQHVGRRPPRGVTGFGGR